MKKILVLLKTFLNRSETFTYNIIKNLKEFNPIIHTERVNNLENFPIDYKIYKYDKKIENKWFQNTSRRINLQNEIYKICQKEQIELIYANSFDRAIYAQKATKELAIPLYSHCRGGDLYIKHNYNAFRKRITPYIHHFICVSEHMKRFLENNYKVATEKIAVHYGGIDLDLFDFQKENQQNWHKKKVLMVGRFAEKKGFSYGIHAFAIASSLLPELTLNIVGNGPLKKQLLTLVKKLSLENKVFFLGEMFSKDIAKIMKESSLLLSPHVTASNGDSEGIPNVIKEALAIGLPVVTTEHTGIPEIIENNFSGLCYAEKDIKGLADGILKVCNDFSFWQKCRRNGRLIIEEKFDNKKQIKKFTELLSL